MCGVCMRVCGGMGCRGTGCSFAACVCRVGGVLRDHPPGSCDHGCQQESVFWVSSNYSQLPREEDEFH